jgi:hypothetical protein
MKKILRLIVGFIFLLNVSHAQQAKTEVGKPIVIKPNYFDISPPLRDMYQDPKVKIDRSWKDGAVENHFHPSNLVQKNYPGAINSDPNVQKDFGLSYMTDTTIQNFDGTAGTGSLCPPDPAGDVGPNHYLQIVNCEYSVYDKSGNVLLGPYATSQIWSGLPNNVNDGDGIVLYDEEADRWLISQFSVPTGGPYYENVAISQTNDPTGSWYRYQFQFTYFPDYPKFGVWPDAYYLCTNLFNGNAFIGPGASALDRTKMLAGNPNASMIFFQVGNASYYHGLPADCDGTFPPLGTPGYFLWSSTSKMYFYEFHADFTTPSNSTFTQAQQLGITPFTYFAYGVGIPQKGTSVQVDPLSYDCTIMNRLQFRNFSDHWSMVTNATVDVGSNVAGIRWYEFRKIGSDPWYAHQEATYAPNDGNSRWCGSIAMDTAGNIALGFSISSSSMYPSIRYTGRMSCDPLNQFTINESGIINGGGSQTNTWSGTPSRWGDYSAMNIDPAGTSKFWYTNEYYSTSSQANWRTRIASFSFADVFNLNGTANPSTICSGQSSQLTVNPTGGSGIYTYTWTSIPAGFNSSQSNPVVMPTVSTQYIAAVNDGTTTKTDTIPVTVILQPTAFAGDDTTYKNTIPLFVAKGSAANFSSVQWFTSGDGHFNIDTVPVSLYYPGSLDRNDGGVNLTLKAYPMGTCTDTASSTVHITLSFPAGIGENSSGVFGFTLSPNPSNGTFTLVIDGIKNSEATIAISDLAGSVIYSEKEITGNKSVKEINLTGYSKGIYFVKVFTDKQSETKKLVLQ